MSCSIHFLNDTDSCTSTEHSPGGGRVRRRKTSKIGTLQNLLSDESEDSNTEDRYGRPITKNMEKPTEGNVSKERPIRWKKRPTKQSSTPPEVRIYSYKHIYIYIYL